VECVNVGSDMGWVKSQQRDLLGVDHMSCQVAVAAMAQISSRQAS